MRTTERFNIEQRRISRNASSPAAFPSQLSTASPCAVSVASPRVRGRWRPPYHAVWSPSERDAPQTPHATNRSRGQSGEEHRSVPIAGITVYVQNSKYYYENTLQHRELQYNTIIDFHKYVSTINSTKSNYHTNSLSYTQQNLKS